MSASWDTIQYEAEKLVRHARYYSASEANVAKLVTREFKVPRLNPACVVFVDSNAVALPINCYHKLSQ